MICDLRCLACPYSECIRDKRQKEVYKRYYEKHREKRLAYQHKYNREHKEQLSAYEKKRWQKKKEQKQNEKNKSNSQKT